MELITRDQVIDNNRQYPFLVLVVPSVKSYVLHPALCSNSTGIQSDGNSILSWIQANYAEVERTLFIQVSPYHNLVDELTISLNP